MYHPKKILLTGGAGFLGSRVREKLIADGVSPAQIIIPRSADYDLRREDKVKQLLDETKPDTIIHLAAKVGGIGFNRENPGSLLYDNLAMGLHLIEQARLHNVKKFVFISTICAYPKFTPIPFKEEDLWNGYPEETNAPYGLAKKIMLVQLQAYRQQYGFNGIYLLPVNLYGPEDNFDPTSSHVIPALIKKFCDALKNGATQVEVWGTGSASREFLYVDDAAEGIVKALYQYEKPDPVNLGAGKEILIRDLVETIARLTGFKGEVVWDRSKPDGQPRRCLDVSKAQKEFGFSATMPFEEGLKRTIDWYLRQKDAR